MLGTGDPERRVIGVLGGMGPAASAFFCLRLAQLTDARRDQDHAHVLLDSDASVPDRTAHLLGEGPDPLPQLTLMARRLAGAGAELLVIACNSASPFTPGVEAAVSAPVVDWVREAVTAVARQHPEAQRVAVLATAGSRRAGVYQRRLLEVDRQDVWPDEQGQRAVSAAIDAVKAGQSDLDLHRARVTAAAEECVTRGAGVVVLACTELSLLFWGRPPECSVPTADALDLAAVATLSRAGVRVRTPTG
jgi:aspartate racemase